MLSKNKWPLNRPKTKKFLLNIIINPIKNRPRLWIRILIPFYTTKERRSHICRRVRKDIPSLCVVAGNPARIIKAYNKLTKSWE